LSSPSVILIAYYSDPWIKNCLDTLSHASGNNQHLVLVNNAGNSRLNELTLDQYYPEMLETPRPLGFAEANNFALIHSRGLGEYIVFLNQDTKSPAGWLDTCISLLNNNPQIGAVSPFIRNYDDTGWDPSFLHCLTEDQKINLESVNEVIYTQNAPAPALIVRKEVLAKTGPFDPVFGSYYEDYDLCRRIRQAGYRIGFAPSARIQHYSGSATNNRRKELKRMQQIIRNRTLYELRESEENRFLKTMKVFLRDFPYRLGRSLLGTPSSQPPIVVIRAYWQLAGMWKRLASKAADEKLFADYIREIQWNLVKN